jgi:hypothetical protein
VVRQTLIAMVLGLPAAMLAPAAPAADKAAETQAALRDLWSEHIFWARNVVTATTQKRPDAAKVAEAQVVANARQIADSIAPFYGKAASDSLFELLKGHYGPIRQYLDAGDKAGRDKATKALQANAGQIAKFLSDANPHLPYDAVNGLLLAHGAHHAAQIDQLKAGQYAQEAETWHTMRKHMNQISDAIAGAIAEQFPDKFS